jgi:hypothetical protein
MILPDFILPSRVNQQWQYSGIDSIEHCLNKKHFKSYPHKIEYRYNSRGFRDTEWPSTLEELKKAIWCIGDSFTVGLGSPVEHTWPYILQQQTGQRTINVSMDGASNNWIARKVLKILSQVQPELIVIHWSYLHRREVSVDEAQLKWWQTYYKNIKDTTWPQCPTPADFASLPEFIQNEIITKHAPGPFYQISDEDRVMHFDLKNVSIDLDKSNTLECIRVVESQAKATKILHSFIPDYMPNHGKNNFKDQLLSLVQNFIGEIAVIDYARDKHHYDIKTSQVFVQQIHQCLN